MHIISHQRRLKFVTHAVETVHITHVVVVVGHLSGGLFSLFLEVLVVHVLLSVLLLEVGFLGEFLGLLDAVGDDDVIKDGSGGDLPQLESDVRAPVLADLVHFVVVLEIGIVDHRVHPRTLVVRVFDLLLHPRPLVLRVVNHRWLPVAVVLVIPVLRLGGVRIGNFGGDVVVSCRLGVLRVRHHFLVHPIGRLAGIGVLDLLGRQEVELILQLARSHRGVVDLDLEGVVGVEDEGVEVGDIVILAGDLLLDEEVFVLGVGVEDDVGLLVGGPAHVGAEHDAVGAVTAEAGGVEGVAARQQLEVGAAAVQVLLVLDAVLDDQRLVGGDEGLVHLGGEAVEPGVLARLDSLVGGVAVPLAGSVLPGSHLGLWLPLRGLRPS
mmetsp:Transcript_27887/g.78151  ORF Transcript_27887/g.78151 Transcript_27887/m.78151 type:complete len:379 (+) Transcript_27887:324-1460(+)